MLFRLVALSFPLLPRSWSRDSTELFVVMLRTSWSRWLAIGEDCSLRGGRCGFAGFLVDEDVMEDVRKMWLVMVVVFVGLKSSFEEFLF